TRCRAVPRRRPAEAYPSRRPRPCRAPPISTGNAQTYQGRRSPWRASMLLLQPSFLLSFTLEPFSGAAAGSAAGRRLPGAHECTHEFVLYQRRDRIHVEAFAGQELPRIFDAVNARGLNIDRIETGLRQPLYVIRFFERARDAADP